MSHPLRAVRDFLVSLRLTVVLLAFSLVLVFVATLAQVNLGIWAVQEKYFRSFFVYGVVPGTSVALPIFPGGYFLGGLLLANLVAAHVARFKFEWRKAGIQLTHSGLILLLVGELVTGLLQEDFQMQINEGETRNYAESFRRHELVLIDTTDAKDDQVVAIPIELVERGRDIQHPALPFRVVPRQFFPNATLAMRDAASAAPALATQGIGARVALTPHAISYSPDLPNSPAAIVELVGPDGALGTWLVSTDLPATNVQGLDFAGRKWRLALRVLRDYRPFSLTLLKVNHDVYPGTDIPKNFSSRIKLATPDGRDDREVLIYMNNPLRHAGLTFYQYQMDASRGHTVLQVVRNPGWLLPYVACLMMALGLSLQFGLSLAHFFARRRAAA